MKYTKTSNIYTRVQESGYGGAHRANNFLIFKYQTLYPNTHSVMCLVAEVPETLIQPCTLIAMALTSLSDIDAIIVRYADTLSPEQIAVKLEGALTPEQVLNRIYQLTATPDWLTLTMEDALVTRKMRNLVNELEEQPRTARNAEILVRALEAVGKRLDNRMAATEQDLTKLYAFQGAAMLDAILATLTHIREKINVEIDDETWNNALESGMRVAQIEVSKHEE